MIFGADSQNKNLSDAASKRVDTSPRTRTSNALAAKISTSKTGGSKQSEVVQESRSSLKGAKSDPVRGSKEGLVDGSSTVIQMSGDGYDNPGIQRARYEQSQIGFKQNNNISNKLNFSSKKNGIIDNQSSTFNLNTSAYMLKEHLKADQLLGK